MAFELRTGNGATISFNPAGSIEALTTPSTIWAGAAQTPLVRIRYAHVRTSWEARDWEELTPDKVEIAYQDKSLAITCRGFGGQDIMVVLIIAPYHDRFTCEIEVMNHAPGVLVGVEAPIFGKLAANPEATLYIPDRAGQRIPHAHQAFPERQIFSYPVPLSCQFLTVNTGNEGWAIFCQDEAMAYKELGFGGEEGSVSFVQYPFVESGGSAMLAPVSLMVYTGSWHVAADAYRAWYTTWANQPVFPSLLHELPVIALLVVLARPVEDAVLTDVTKSQETGTFAQAIERALEMQACGIEGVHVGGWHTRGHDTDYPDFTPAESAGGRDGLQSFSAAVKAAGMQVGYYLNGRLASLSSVTYQQHPEWAVIPAHGQGQRASEHYGDEDFVVFCPGAPGFINHLAERVEELARDFHADFVQIDQVGAAPSLLCFDPHHGHRSPATAWAEGYMTMLPQLFERAQRHRPGFWIFTEGAWEGVGQVVSLSQGGFWPLTPDAEFFHALSRYLFPDHPMFGDGYWGGVPFIMYGPPPMQHAVVTPAVRFLQRYRDFFKQSEYRDCVGLRWDQPALHACWHQGNRDIAVVAYNPGDQPRATTLMLHLDTLPEAYAMCERLLTSQPHPLRFVDNQLSFELTLAPGEVDGVYVHWE